MCLFLPSTFSLFNFGELHVIACHVEGSTQSQIFSRIVLGLWILFGLSWGALILSEIGSMLQKHITHAASQTQHRLSNLEGMVRKKAKETKDKLDKLAKKDREYSPSFENKKELEAEVCIGDYDSEEELKYEPTESDY